MSVRTMKLITVPVNGQISIGKSWAGRQIRVVELSDSEIHISAGAFVPEAQRTFFTEEAKQDLAKFNEFEKGNPARATDTDILFSALKKKKHSRG